MQFEPDVSVQLVVSHNVLIARWPRTTTVEDVRAAQRALVQLGGRHRKVALLSFLAEGPIDRETTDAVRDESRRLMSMPGIGLVGSAVVFSGQGFAGAILRGILSSFALVAGTGAPMRVFGSAEDAAGWIVASLGADASFSPAELARAAAR